MIFEPINYNLLFEDILFSMAAGMLVAFFYEILGVFLHKGRLQIFIKDILGWVMFSLIVFSFVISFANYPFLRFFHVIGAVIGFLCFTPHFSRAINFLEDIIFESVIGCLYSFFDAIRNLIKNKILKNIIKISKKTKKTKEKHLNKDIIWVYND